MKKIINFKTEKGEFAFVEIPKDAYEIRLETISSNKQINYCLGEFNTIDSLKTIQLNKKIDKILGLVEDLTEEDWGDIVVGYGIDRWHNYKIIDGMNIPQYNEYLCKSATESTKTLIDSLKLEESNWLLIKFE